MRKQSFLKLFGLLLSLLLCSVSVFGANEIGNFDDSTSAERLTLTLDGRLFAWDSKGNPLVGWPIDLSSANRSFVLSPRLIDLDGDGRNEIIAVSRGEGVKSCFCMVVANLVA